ncbi:MAG TPA: transcriptional regulator GcvA [Gammaproteobacteria bacterium]
MENRLPPLNALRAFEAAGRHQSFSNAAKELNVTHAAVSHQVRALEDWLGVTLFERTARSVRLNERGKAYLPIIRGAFDQIHAGTQTLLRSVTGDALMVSAPPAFAVRWLAPRLGNLWNVHPDLDLRLSEITGLDDIDFASADIAVRVGDGNWPNVEVIPLLPGTISPMCSPMLLAEGKKLERPQDLAHFKLLHAYNHNGWRQWIQQAGIDTVDVGRGPVFDDTNLIHSAVVAGQGVGLLHTALTRKELEAGLLVRPFELGPQNDLGYYLVYPSGAAQDRRIEQFRDWLLAQISADEAAA